MSQKQINLYDDSVLKLSIKQGTESDRFPASFDNTSSLDYEITKDLPGSFTMGEPIYTRDTNRVFIGNFTDKQEFLLDDDGNQQIQQTLGGTLVGNKYLGFIDSKPPYNSTSNTAPRSLSEKQTFETANSSFTMGGCLTDNSDFRTYSYVSNDGNSIKTEDGKWSRQSFYNEKYDAYDGDYMYDVYRNALIIFDHNIKPTEGDLTNKTRIRSTIASIQGEPADSLQLVNKHTKDMYGDGYVCLYNIIPDGDTLTFDERGFNTKTGQATTTSKNYTQNIVKVQKVYANAIENALDSRQFTKTISNSGNAVMSLKPEQKFTEIYLDSDSERLTLPNRLGIADNFNADIVKFIPKDGYDKGYCFSYKLLKTENNINYFTAELLPAENIGGGGGATYTIKLGDGLSTATGGKNIILSPSTPNASIQIEQSTSDNDSAIELTIDPYNIGFSDSYSYAGNIAYSSDGKAVTTNTFSDLYNQKAKPLIDLYDNINTSANYLNYTIPLLATSSALNNKLFKFQVEPVIFCSNITASSSAFKVVGITDDITITNNKGYSNTISIDDLKSEWIYFSDGESTPPEGYARVAGVNYVTSALQTPAIAFAKHSKKTPDYVVLKNSSSITIKRAANSNAFTIDGVSENVSKLYFKGIEITSLKEAAESILGSTYASAETEETLTVAAYYTNDLYDDEPAVFEASTEEKLYLISIPTKKYIIHITYDEDTKTYNSEYLRDIVKAEYFYSSTSIDNNSLNSVTRSTRFISEVTENIIAGFSNGDTFTSIAKNVLYGVRLTNSQGEISNISLADSITRSKTTKKSFSTSQIRATATLTEEYIYYPCDSDYGEFTINAQYTSVENREFEYFRSDEIGFDKILEAQALYYYQDAELGFLRCLGDTGDTLFTPEMEDEWINNRKMEILKAFPNIPAHATSILLECETAAGASLTINYAGNEKTTKGLGSISDITSTTGLIIPGNIKSSSSWNNKKQLLTMDASSKTIIEVPIAITENGSRHVSINITSTGSTNINLAGYKA